MAAIFNHTKISFLSNKIIRFEYHPDDKFSSKPSLFVKNKKVDNSSFVIRNGNSDLKIIDYLDGITISFNESAPIDTIKVYKNDLLVYSYKGKSNTGELPLPNKTPFVFVLNDSPRVIIPEEGYSEFGNFIIDKHSRDVFLMFCENDFQQLRNQFMFLTGTNDMPRLKNFGVLYARNKRFTEKDFINEILKFQKHNIPLDNLIIDEEWKNTNEETYEENTKLIPNMSKFISFLHSKNIEVGLNDHPQYLSKKNNAFDKDEIVFRNKCLNKYLGYGLDFWWFDRNYNTKIISPSKRISKDIIGIYSYHDITKQFYQSFSLDSEVYYRPVVLNNIINISNGHYEKITDSSSHIYPYQSSGDISSEPFSIGNEIINMLRCSNNLVGYYSSCIGGYYGTSNKETYIRWIQYGCLSPLFRLHSSSLNDGKGRLPWAYDPETLEITKNFIDLRYRLLNVIYTAAYKHYLNGLGIARPLAAYFLNDKKANNEKTSYMLNDSILVSPILGEKRKSLSENELKGNFKVTYFLKKGRKKEQYKVYDVSSLDSLPKIKDNKIDLNQVTVSIKANVKFKNDVDFYVSNKGCLGTTEVRISKKKVLRFVTPTVDFEIPNFVKKLKAKHQYSIEISFKYDETAQTKLSYIKSNKHSSKKIYLPEGEWFDVTNSNIYQGKRFIKKSYALDKMPLFVKAGSLIPLYSKVNNISLMSLKDITYDFYPSQTCENEDFFYEDDGKTTGYKVGVNRINKYKLSFKEKEYQVTLFASKGKIDDGLTIRNAVFKMHVRDGEKIKEILINGEPVKFYNHDHNKKALPFNTTQFACDSKTTAFKFRQDIKKDYIIKIILM